MVSLRSHATAAAAVGGILILGGLVATPAQGYPAGSALTIVCDAFTYGPGGPATCTLFNINPAGPDDIVVGDLIAPAGAAGAGGAGPQVNAVQQAGTYVEVLVLPQIPGIYEVIGTSADEVATTTVQVVVEGVPTEFSVVVNPDGSVTVRNGQPGCGVTVYVNGQPIGSFVFGDDGTVTVPADVAKLAPGDAVTAKQEASDTCVALEAAEVVVPGSPAKPTTPATPTTPAKPSTPAATTGANVALGFVAGLAALGIGGGLLAAGRRKKV